MDHCKNQQIISTEGKKTEKFKCSTSTFSELAVSGFLVEITIYFYRFLIAH